MQEKEWAFVDKSKWGEGPWLNEPDKMQWVDEDTGLPCLIVRNHGVTGSLCGYVGIDSSHPWFGVNYGECTKGCLEVDPKPLEGFPGMTAEAVEHMNKWRLERKHFNCTEDWTPGHTPESILEVHGGITYSDYCQDNEQGICHVDEDNNSPIFWYGFDCAHAWDLSPKMNATCGDLGIARGMHETYRDVAYVKEEIKSLAKQISAVNHLPIRRQIDV